MSNLYLFGYYSNNLDNPKVIRDLGYGSATKAAVDKLQERHGNRYTPSQYKSGNHVDSTLSFTVNEGTKKHLEFSVSEFPGNCSGLVFHGLESFLYVGDNEENKKEVSMAIAFAEDLAKVLKYAVVFMTGTHPIMKGLLQEKLGFTVCVDNVTNYHSGRGNYYALKYINDFELSRKEAPVAAPEPVVEPTPVTPKRARKAPTRKQPSCDSDQGGDRCLTQL